MSNQNNQPPWGGQPAPGQPPAQAYGQPPQAQHQQQYEQQQQYAQQQQHAQQQQQYAQQQQQAAYAQQQQQQQYAQPPQQAAYGQQQGYDGQQAAQQYGQQATQQGYGQQAQQGYDQAQQQAAYGQGQHGGQQAAYGQQAQQQGYGQAQQAAYGQQQYGQQHQQQQQQQQQPQGYGQQQQFAGQHPGRPPQQHGRGIPGATATAGAPPRVAFIRMTYLHLTGAIFLFAGLSWLLMNNETVIKNISVPITKFSLGGQYNWGVFILLFMGVGYVADMWARKRGSKPLQYLGLGLYVVAEAVIFLPLLFIAEMKGAEIMAKGGGDPHFIRDAGFITVALFTALTASVFLTKKDFSFMRSGLAMGGAGAMVLVVLSIVGGFNLGIIFSFAMVALAGGYVLYYTSQVLAHYDSESYVAASLALFSAIALMFWYVIRILMSLRD